MSKLELPNTRYDIKRQPINDKTNAWNTILPTRIAHASLSNNIKADWLVIGAGYAGVAAARRLAENHSDQKIVVVEAGECGENASGRNSGFVIDVPHTTSSSLDQLEGSHRHMRLARAATQELTALVAKHKIECDWSVDGKYHGAVTDRGAEAMLKPFANELDALGEAYDWVGADELAVKLGTHHFKHAIYTPGCVLMNPAALVRGLADTLPDNVTLYEHSAVVAMTSANGVTVTTSAGSINAPRMILAANGFSDQFGYKANAFVHLALRASLTRPLSQSERDAYGVANPWGLTPANAFGGVTMRYTNDHRLLIRQDIKLSMQQNMLASKTQAIKAQHLQVLRDRFPSIPEVTLEDIWVGYICMSRNGAPAFGKLASNIWISACQNGIGVTKGTISGLCVADLASGRDNPLIDDLHALGTPELLPLRPLLEVGARAKICWETFKNRHEA
ncbi:MAG: FAD-binding oxidoreductase [Granulosicoccaceae bacterium]